MENLSRRDGSWTITHVPGEPKAYDLVLGRMTPWALLVEHDTGWRIIHFEKAPTAEIVTPGGFPVANIDVADWSSEASRMITVARHVAMIEALQRWVDLHADEYDEPRINE